MTCSCGGVAGIVIGTAEAPTCIGAWAITGMDKGTSSSTKLFTIVPAGTFALVPVMKKPAGAKTIADTACSRRRRLTGTPAPRKNPMKPRIGDTPQRLVANAKAEIREASLPSRNVASAAGKRDSNVETYRLYCLDGVGKVASAEWIEALDDQAATEIANRLRGGRACELWQNSRLVARLGNSGEKPS